MSRIDVAKEFATCVRALGGTILDNVLKNPQFQNADYWFPRYKVVAELKCLTEDLSKKADFNKQLTALHTKWVRQGLVPKPQAGRIKISTRTLPAECARDFLDLLKTKVETGIVWKANRQIRETKSYLDVPDATGLLLLVNDGNFMFPPSVMAHMLARLTKGQHSSINSVIYFSVNEQVSVPGVEIPSLFWFDGVVNGREAVPPDLRGELQERWMAHYSGLVPGPVYEIALKNDVALIDQIQFRR